MINRFWKAIELFKIAKHTSEIVAFPTQTEPLIEQTH